MRRIKYLGDQCGPNDLAIPYSEGSQLWHVLVDFACMPKREFTTQDAYFYYELDKAWDLNSSAATYYNDTILRKLQEDGFITFEVSK